jgi:SRSO17 transposase
MSEVNEVDHQAMQHMLTEGCVDWQGFGTQLAMETDALLGGSKSVLIFDESAFDKKGDSSAGVARQWNGCLGKVDNCQVGVFAALCRGDMASLIDTRLYLPEAWANDPDRCTKASIPEKAQCYQSKTTLALAMLETAIQRGIRFGYVGIDGGYGKEAAFLRAVDRLDCRFVADVHCDQTIYLQDPEAKVPDWNGCGTPPSIAKPNALHNGLTGGRPRSPPRLGSSSPCARAKKAY